MSPRSKNVILWACRLTLAAAFLYAGIVKISNPEAFAASIASFELLPESWSNLLALALPPFEILCGVLILFPRRCTRLGALGIALMSFVFLIALSAAVARGIPVDCGCFGSKGPSSPSTIWMAIGRDIVLLGIASFVYRRAVSDS